VKEKANYRIGVFYMLLVVWIVELGNSLRILDYFHSNVRPKRQVTSVQTVVGNWN